MAHRSDSNYSLRVFKHKSQELETVSALKSRACVYLFHLPHSTKSSDRLNERTFSNYLGDFLSSDLPEDTVVVFISDTKSALQIIPQLRNKLKYRLWVAIERESPLQRKNCLPDNHAAITIFSKNKKQFKHSKVQIKYTTCPSCGKTTKDYGGKKHLYSPYGTLMTDVWRDIKIQEEGFPGEIVKRLSDLFAVEPLAELVYFDLRNQSHFYRSTSPAVDSSTVSTDVTDSQIHSGDCVEVIKSVPESSVDFIFADPPYNIKKKYENWDDSIQIEKYFHWCDRWIEELHRVLKPGRVFCIINIPLRVVRHYIFAKSLFEYVDYVVWEGLSLPVRNIMPAHYGILCLSKGKFKGISNYDAKLNRESLINSSQSLKEWYCVRQSCVKNRNLPEINDREPITNLWWDIHRLKHNSKRVDHPCQLPPDLMKRLIYTFSKPNELVLDPFNGAGTTTLVAELMNRRYIGIELSDKYHEIAKKRHAEIRNGTDPFRKNCFTPKSKNSRVRRLAKQNYKVSKKVLQLEVRKIAISLGRKPTREDVKEHTQYPFEYFENYFIDWGEVCAAVGNKGMREDLQYSQKEKSEQLTLLEKQKQYKKTKRQATDSK